MDERMTAQALAWGIELDYHETVTSTNDLARDSRYGAGAVVMAEQQTQGRGQRGNRWESPAGVNLTFSVVLCPDFLEADRQFYISRVIALALTDALATEDFDPRIKWPNDIYLGDRKVAGILIENDLTGYTISRSIAGVGLNVNQTLFDPELPNPTSLCLEAGGEIDRVELFGGFFTALARRYEQLGEGRFAELGADYLARLYRRNEEHFFKHGETGERFAAVIVDVGAGGELYLRHSSDDTVRSYLFKEIEYEIVKDFLKE